MSETVKMTITEALAELKTIEKRIENKKTFVKNNLARQEMIKDPLEKEGGQNSAVNSEVQSMMDLLNRRIAIRRAIQLANQQTIVQIKTMQMSVYDWIVWKREVMPVLKQLFNDISNQIAALRRDTTNKGLKIADGTNASPNDIIININEKWLKENIEYISEVEGTLDGQLSLKNAVVLVEF